MDVEVIRVAAFSENGSGGNPAGVVVSDTLPAEVDMQRIAAEVGYSETVFACPQEGGWRARYFAPEMEVPFCGHATIALGAVLAMQNGSGVFDLTLNEAQISVEGHQDGDRLTAALQSPPTRTAEVKPQVITEALALFGYSEDQLNGRLPPRLVHGGADHLAITLNSREALAGMSYDIEAGKKLMTREGWVTIILAYAENRNLFHTRNPFASGGVYEDPATGAATAAFAGYLRETGWLRAGAVDVVQGEDMGMRSRLRAEYSAEAGSSIRVSGEARLIGGA